MFYKLPVNMLVRCYGFFYVHLGCWKMIVVFSLIEHGIALNLICFSLLCRRSCRRSGRKVEKVEQGYLIRLYRPDNKSEKN
jgi:hypothetical protein